VGSHAHSTRVDLPGYDLSTCCVVSDLVKRRWFFAGMVMEGLA
jgi:hypothetical protein